MKKIYLYIELSLVPSCKFPCHQKENNLRLKQCLRRKSSPEEGHNQRGPHPYLSNVTVAGSCCIFFFLALGLSLLSSIRFLRGDEQYNTEDIAVSSSMSFLLYLLWTVNKLKLFNNLEWRNPCTYFGCWYVILPICQPRQTKAFS